MAANVLRMNDADTIKFLEFYQNEPVLWDPTREDYRNRNSRAAAARRIASAMAIDGFTDVHVITKFKNLRSSYSQELKKIQQSTKSGCSPDDVYTPKVRWFRIMDSFLRPHVKGRETQSNLEDPDRKKRKNTESENEEPLSREGMVPQQLLDEGQSTTSQKVQGPTEPSKKDQPIIPTAFRKKKVCLTPVGDDINSAIEKLDVISKRAATSSVSKDDCFNLFGRYIASLLRSLPQHRSSQLQAAIVSMILEPPIPHMPSRQSQYSNSPSTSTNTQYGQLSDDNTSTQDSVFSPEHARRFDH